MRGRADNQHSQIAIATQAERAKANGISKRQQEKLDAIARLRPDLLEAVRAGRMKTDAAYREAMGKKKVKPFDIVVGLLPKLTPTEKRKLKGIALPAPPVAVAADPTLSSHRLPTGVGCQPWCILPGGVQAPALERLSSVAVVLGGSGSLLQE